MSDSQDAFVVDNSVPTTSAEEEGRWHSYVGSRIPWYIRLFWVGFWVFAVYYTITYLFPTMQVEIPSPP
jgi:hypothetical protein